MQLTPTQGKYTFDQVKKILFWDIGRIDPAKVPSIKGYITLQTGASIPESNPSIHVSIQASNM